MPVSLLRNSNPKNFLLYYSGRHWRRESNFQDEKYLSESDECEWKIHCIYEKKDSSSKLNATLWHDEKWGRAKNRTQTSIEWWVIKHEWCDNMTLS